MAQTSTYKVLRPIELNGTLYLPAGATPPMKPRSAGSGEAVNVDTSGVIELTADQAAAMTLGQIQAISTQRSAVNKQKKSAES
jgi:hypothetical protein